MKTKTRARTKCEEIKKIMYIVLARTDVVQSPKKKKIIITKTKTKIVLFFKFCDDLFLIFFLCCFGMAFFKKLNGEFARIRISVEFI